MKIVYISGPYSAPSDLEVNQNIFNAQRAAVLCVKEQIGYFCPHLNSYHMQVYSPQTPYDFYLKLDLSILSFCSAILMLPKWTESKGAIEELDYFHSLGRRRFYMKNLEALPQELTEWYHFKSSK